MSSRLKWLIEPRADSSTPLWTSSPVEVVDFIIWENGKLHIPPKKIPQREATLTEESRNDLPKSNQMHHLLNPREGISDISLIKWPLNILDMISGILPEKYQPKKIDEQAAPVRSAAARKEMIKRVNKLTAVNKISELFGKSSALPHRTLDDSQQSDSILVKRTSSSNDSVGLTDSSGTHPTPTTTSLSTDNLLQDKLTAAPVTSSRELQRNTLGKSPRSVIEDQLEALKRRQDARKKTLDKLVGKLSALEGQLEEYALVGKQEESLMLKGIEDITKKIIAKLSGDEKRLFRSFIRHDSNANGFILFSDLCSVIKHGDTQKYDDSILEMLQQFINVEIINEYPPEGSEISFFDLCNIWSGWEAIKTANGIPTTMISRLPTVDNGVKDFMEGLQQKINSARERRAILGNVKEVMNLVCVTAGLTIALSSTGVCYSTNSNIAAVNSRIAGSIEDDIADSVLSTERSYLSILYRALNNSKNERHDRRLSREAAGRKELQNNSKWSDDVCNYGVFFIIN